MTTYYLILGRVLHKVSYTVRLFPKVVPIWTLVICENVVKVNLNIFALLRIAKLNEQQWHPSHRGWNKTLAEIIGSDWNSKIMRSVENNHTLAKFWPIPRQLFILRGVWWPAADDNLRTTVNACCFVCSWMKTWKATLIFLRKQGLFQSLSDVWQRNVR